MSGRCIGCNSILTEEDLKRKWYSSQEYTNLCYYCFDKANDILDYQEEEYFDTFHSPLQMS